MKFSEWFWITGKRNRKSYFFFMFLGLFALWGLFKLLGLVERSVFYQVLIYAAATQQMTFMLNVISVIFIFYFLYLFWFLFCNSIKRMHDIGLSTKLAVVLESVRYVIILNIILARFNIMELIIKVPQVTEFFLFVMPILIGVIKSKKENKENDDVLVITKKVEREGV